MHRIRIGVNGFGRIGRAILRRALADPRFEVAWINDLNPDEKNICYMFNYDSIQGASARDLSLRAISSKVLRFGSEGPEIKYSSKNDVSRLNCSDIDVLIDATGVSTNGVALRSLIQQFQGLKVLVTHCHPDADCCVVLGANHDSASLGDSVLLSSSICDATALGPVLRALDEAFGVRLGHITTVHPWLSYQNLLDGPSTSWSHPGQIHHHYPLGRAALDNLIPKPTSAVAATLKSLPEFKGQLSSFSYRVPTSIVGSADMVLQLNKAPRSEQEIVEVFNAFDARFKWPLLAMNDEPLISKDFVNRPESAIIDTRWLDLIDRQIHLILWYDNENGYSARVLDQAELIASGEAL